MIGTVKPNSVRTGVPRAIGKAGAIGVTLVAATESAEVPPSLSAVAVKVCAEPLPRPLTVQCRLPVRSVISQVCPPGSAVTM